MTFPGRLHPYIPQTMMSSAAETPDVVMEVTVAAASQTQTDVTGENSVVNNSVVAMISTQADGLDKSSVVAEAQNGTSPGTTSEAVANQPKPPADEKTAAPPPRAETTTKRRISITTEQQQQQHEKPTRKRSMKCPTKDTILIELPLHVTADLGVAIRRTRRNRIRRIKQWMEANLTDAGTKGANTATQNDSDLLQKLEGKRLKDDEALDDEDEMSDDDDGKTRKPARNLEDDDDEFGEGGPRREQYGSVLDYLEAKYTRGVMIADYDEKERAKKKKSQMREKAKQQGKGEEHHSDVDSEADGSCYSDGDGWIDDSLLQVEVADQVLASSSYGKTKIEEDALKRKQRKGGKVNADGDEEQGGGMDGGDKSADEHSEDGLESDLDDGFFVNLGDLEMAEGWSGDHDIVISPSKKRVKKRAKKGEGKSNKLKKSDGKTSKVTGHKALKKVKVKSAAKTLTPKKKKAIGDKSTTPVKKKASSAADDGKKKQSGISKQSTSPKAKNSPKVPVATPAKPESKSPKEFVDQLAILFKSRYDICVSMIRELTPAHLPRKKRAKKNTVKVSVSIPPDKTIGDEITFA